MYIEPDFEDFESELDELYGINPEDAITEPDDDPTEIELMVLLSGMVTVIGNEYLH